MYAAIYKKMFWSDKITLIIQIRNEWYHENI